MKKFLGLMLVLLTIFIMGGCGSIPTDKPSDGAQDATQQSATATQQTAISDSNTDTGASQQTPPATQETKENAPTKETPKEVSPTESKEVAKATPQPAPEKPVAQTPKESGKNPIVTIEMADGKKIVAELYPKIAPNTVNNFISLIKKGFYDGLIFHRVIPDFMIQGGDPDGNGMGGPGYNIKGEFTQNGFKNDLLHTKGVLSMARTQAPDTAGSQFFIMAADVPDLDYQYASFGKVLSGIEEVDKIVNTERDGNDRPLKEQKMKKVTVETFGVTYPEPVKQ